MAKLFPPIVEETIPAFYSKGKGMVITIPFLMNKAVNKNLIKGFAVKVKTLQNSSYFYSLSSLSNDNNNTLSYNLINNTVILSITDENLISKFKIGQFYKFQIAYIDLNDEIGFYSIVTIGKYTAFPSIYIANLSEGAINSHLYNYQGCYNNIDNTENIYSYFFNVYDEMNNIIFTSGEQLHNSNNDTELNISIDTFYVPLDLKDKIYYIQYNVTTVNNLELSSTLYPIQQKLLIDMDVEQPKLEAVIDNIAKDNGYISVNFYSEDNSSSNIKGNFIIYRADNTDNFLRWEECHRFYYNTKLYTWNDFTVESGKLYQYAISQYDDNNLISQKIYSNFIEINFEDIFLYDGNRQLKIKFNPKVSSFKNNNLETKIETIGSQYPFILRNGKVSYKEFPISGLISYLMDENHFFLKEEEPKSKEIQDYTFIDLVDANINQERKFKTEVLKWLSNGEPKLFKSSTEGNFLVKLLNVSLTPIDNLGRMLHTFNCTAYEIAESTYENMCKLNMIKRNQTVNNYFTYWKSIELINMPININILPTTAKTISFTDMTPGDKILITLEDGSVQEIQIGATGVYEIKKLIPIISVVLLNKSTGIVTYSFEKKQINEFNKFTNINIINIPARQFINNSDIIKTIKIKNLLDLYEVQDNPKLKINNIYYIKVFPIDPNQYSNNQYIKINKSGNEIKILHNKIFKDKELYKNLFNEDEESELFIGSNLILEIGYSIKSTDYKIEQYEIYQINKAYQNYLIKIEELNNLYKLIENNKNELDIDRQERINMNKEILNKKEEIKKAYQSYISVLKIGIKKDAKSRGEI